MSRPTYGYGADDPRPEDPQDGSSGESPSLPAYGHPDDGARPPAHGDASAAPSGTPDDAPFGSPDDGWQGRDASYGQVSPAASRSAEGSPPRFGLPAHGSGPDGRTPASGGDFPMDGSAPSSEEPPVCPRHPDRVSYVRCQRCHRPACPECQRPAAVGIVCVDCAREMEGARRQSAPRTLLGGIRAGGRPIVTMTIIGICVVLFLGQMVSGGLVEQLLIFAPYRALDMPWTFLTAGFLHGGIAHIALNMVALWMVGPYLEQAMGRGRFVAVYLVSVLAGNTAVFLLTDALSQSWLGGTLGASGGIFGLFGSLFVVNRRMGAQSSQVLVLIGLNLVITFIVPQISWQGHLGGLVLGTATTALLFAVRPTASPGADRVALARRSALLHSGVIAGAFVLCLVLIGVRVATLPAGAYLLLPF